MNTEHVLWMTELNRNLLNLNEIEPRDIASNSREI